MADNTSNSGSSAAGKRKANPFGKKTAPGQAPPKFQIRKRDLQALEGDDAASVTSASQLIGSVNSQDEGATMSLLSLHQAADSKSSKQKRSE